MRTSSNDNKTQHVIIKMSGKKISNLQQLVASYCHSRMFAVDQETFETVQNV